MYGHEIKENRKIRKITQIEASQRSGLPQSTISWIERDRGIPNIQQCISLANAYEISLDELVGREDYGTGIIEIKQEPSEIDCLLNCLSKDDKVALLNSIRALTRLNKPHRDKVEGYIKALLEEEYN